MTSHLAKLTATAYPGRIIIIGLSSDAEKGVVVYAITGRSPSSQARELTVRGNAVWVMPTDEDVLKQGNLDLLVYSAIAFGRGIAVSNGRQTDVILNQILDKDDPKKVLENSLGQWAYEPDSPHFTPRISGCILPGGKACLSIIRKGKTGSADRSFFAWALEPGKGRLITTYSGKEVDPLPSFVGSPLPVEIKEKTAAALAEAVYAALKPRNPEKDYRVAVACVYAEISQLQKYELHIINKKKRK